MHNNNKQLHSPYSWKGLEGEVNRTIVHMDLDSYFVSVSRLMHPELIGKPVLVGGSSDRGVVAACSYEARAFGIHSAMPMKLAKRLCPHALVVRGDYEEYSKRSDEVTQIIGEYVPLFERSSIDEFYMDFTGMDKFFGCYNYATELRRRIMRETGLPISFGMSPNKTVSKVATDEAKPNNQMKVDPGCEKSFLAPLSVKKIPMIGEKTYTLLRSMGIEKVHTLQQMPLELMQNVLGENGGSIWRKANGIDTSPVEPYSERKSISSEETFDTDTIDVQKLKNILIKMVEKLAFQLRSENKLTACVTVKIRYSNFDTHTMQCRIAHSSNDHVLIARVKELFEKLYSRRMLIRLIGVRFSNLVGGGYQINLFEDSEQLINLYQAMDKMRILYGPQAVHRAVALSNSLRTFNPFNGVSSSPDKKGKLNEEEYEYRLLITLPAKVKNELLNEKKHFAQHYGFLRAEKNIPQIELAVLQLDESKEQNLIETIEAVCVAQQPFEVQLCNFDVATPSNIHIPVKAARAGSDFSKTLRLKLQLPPSRATFHYRFSLLLAGELTGETFNKAQPEYQTKQYQTSFIAQSITLLKRKSAFEQCFSLGEFEFCNTGNLSGNS